MIPKHHHLPAFVLTLAFASAVEAETIAATNFDGRTLPSSNTASNLNWTLNGVEDPGDMAAFRDGGGAQALFDANSTVQNIFAPGINTGNGNTFWTTEVALAVAEGASVTLTDVSFDYWAINGGQVQNVNRRSDFTVTLIDPSLSEVEAVTVADVLNGTSASPGAGTPVSVTFTSPVPLTDPGTYTVVIKGGDFTGSNETGNHTAIDNLSINGTTGGGPGELRITEIVWSGGNVVLTTNLPAAALTPQVSQDLTGGSFSDVDSGQFSVTGANEITIDSAALTAPSDYFRVRE